MYNETADAVLDEFFASETQTQTKRKKKVGAAANKTAIISSKEGATQALRYLPIPGKYDGSYPYKKGDKAWAT